MELGEFAMTAVFFVSLAANQSRQLHWVTVWCTFWGKIMHTDINDTF